MGTDDRDKLKKQSPPAGVAAQLAVPVEFMNTDEPITGNYSGEDLARMRRTRRSTHERIERLEIKHDNLQVKVDETHGNVNVIKGQMEVLPKLVGLLESQLKARTDDDHLILKQTLEYGGHEQKARLETQSFVMKSRWAAIGKIVGVITSSAVVGAIISALARTHC